MTSLRTFLLVACAGVLLFGARAADAQVLKCKNSAGHVTYTQGSCPPGTQPLDSSSPANGNVAGTPARPEGAVQSPASTQHEDCPATLTLDGSDADVRACSTAQSLPSTAHWAQVSQQIKDVGGYRQWSGDYICLRFIAVTNAEGGTTRRRPFLTVTDAMRAGARVPGYQLTSVPNQVFPTKVAAVEAGCAAAKSQ